MLYHSCTPIDTVRNGDTTSVTTVATRYTIGGFSSINNDSTVTNDATVLNGEDTVLYTKLPHFKKSDFTTRLLDNILTEYGFEHMLDTLTKCIHNTYHVTDSSTITICQ